MLYNRIGDKLPAPRLTRSKINGDGIIYHYIDTKVDAGEPWRFSRRTKLVHQNEAESFSN